MLTMCVNCGYQEKPSLKKARKHHLLQIPSQYCVVW